MEAGISNCAVMFRWRGNALNPTDTLIETGSTVSREVSRSLSRRFPDH
jgi:hypothetical protein